MGGDLLTFLVMVIQYAMGFLVARIGMDKAKRWIPVVTAVTSLIYNTGLAFAKAAGALAPAHAAIANQVVLAGFFGSLGNVFLDVLKDTLAQTFLVTGAHSAPKNTRQAMRKTN